MVVMAMVLDRISSLLTADSWPFSYLPHLLFPCLYCSWNSFLKIYHQASHFSCSKACTAPVTPTVRTQVCNPQALMTFLSSTFPAGSTAKPLWSS